MTRPNVGVDVSGGQLQGIVGAGSVVIENLTFYSRPAEEPTQSADAEPIGPCPYPGLAYFGPNEADLFFGRDAAITRLAEAIGRQSFTALVGASGSGKSSVVLAGLAPRLNSAGNWRFSHFRIGTELESNPFLALARALAPLYVASDSDVERLRNTKLLATSLQAGELTLRDVFADCRSRNKGRRILLIADQFEEAFTLVGDDELRTRFIDVLLAGFPDPAAGAVPDICLILTMRADFYGRALRHRPLADALQNHVENLGPMNREELETAIVTPAENAGVTFESGVVETLLDTVQSKPGGLPLMQFALREMWGSQQRKKITRESYDEIGGVEGALAQRAETVFAGLTKNDPTMDKAFQRLFTRLVTLGEGQEDTRRVVERTELSDEVWGLAQRLAGEENRLVVTNAASARETAEVVHEALIRNWPKLVDWINRDRAFQSWLRQIRSNIELWSAAPDDEGPLLRGGMLAQARDWLARRRDDLSGKELAYIEASVALSRRLEAEKEAARQAEIKRQQELAEAANRLANEQRRRARIAVGLGGVAAAAAILAIGLAVYAVSERRRASQEAAKAETAKHDALDQAAVAKTQTRAAQISRILMVSGLSIKETAEGRPERGLLLALAVDPERVSPGNLGLIKRADVPGLTVALERAIYAGADFRSFNLGAAGTAVSWHPDGRRIVTAADDGTARIWDAGSGREIRKLSGHQDRIRTAVFSSDGRRIVTASEDKTARIWDVESGQEIHALAKHQSKVYGAAFSADGQRIVTASIDQTGRIWDAESGQELLVLREQGAAVHTAAFSADGRRVATGSYDKMARIWDVETGREIMVLTGHQERVFGVAFSTDGRLILTASGDRTARIWDAETGKKLGELTGHFGVLYSAAFSADGRRIVTASGDKTARIWDTESGQELRALTGHQSEVVSAAFSADGRHVATASRDGTARIWDLEADQDARALTAHTGTVSSVAFSADGRHIVTASADRTVWRWDAETGQALGALRHRSGVYSAVFSTDRRRIVTTSTDKITRIWDAESGEEVRALVEHPEPVISAVFSPDGRYIVTTSTDKTARILDAESGEELRALRGHDAAVVSAAFSPDGRRIVTASFDRTARIWDAESGEELLRLAGHLQVVNRAAFSADGRRIVTASTDQTAKIWDADNGDELRTFVGHPNMVHSAAFSADGRRIVTASADRTARIWDVETGQQLRLLTGHRGPVRGAAFSADGRRIVTASEDRTVRIWTLLPLVDVWEFARQRKHRELTEAEKKEFFLQE